MRSPFDRLVAWAATRLGYVPASRLEHFRAKTKRAGRMVCALRVDAEWYRASAARAHAQARMANLQKNQAQAELARFQAEFERYRDSLLSSRYGIRVLDRQQHHDGESVTMALRPPANPL